MAKTALMESASAEPIMRNDEFKVISCTVKPLTSELAVEFRDMPGSVSERPLNEKHVENLVARLRRGWGVPMYWVTMKLPDGSVVRINGHHSSTAAAQLNGSLPEGMSVVHTELEGGGPEAPAVAFRQFDAKLAARTSADVANAYKQTHQELRDLDSTACKQAIEGICWYAHHVKKTNDKKGDDRYEEFRDPAHYPFLAMMNGVIGIKGRCKELREQAVLGAFYAMFEADADKAKDFILQVAATVLPEEDGTDNPAKVLDTFLEASYKNLEVGSDGEPGRPLGNTMKASELYNACIFAWRAFREGKKIRKVKYPHTRGTFYPHNV